ncbi:MAG: autotransporter assembly complex protein TamA [Candidatus Thiodiazotropha sp. (ex Lucinoma aequizonata)]|nr:autotransporter assembly complex protein TamA [Candidatus Thiodiazotropha sp. (ex Lucinoma aequizonata)]MCU7887918.1 autotransporter assembly complex protein TamA [Candidatus Thiodiazotropha sp. (ex Lucinoma aequizonata)]MCU7896084.1 autotransporter assembly complex protein TamA [Candidatus Thiodiazotropha sp. (ex Lucinoma aequizonata)]MCU7898056.1 autotransporter assembly complex protein TamA [Candidatus Thiodiazotropha sp. (ex Lucinoma aequizonata)]MCU7900712.1 autotransporter assembly com
MRHLIYILFWLLIPFSVQGLEVIVKVEGLESRLEDNVLAYLSVEREKKRDALNEARLRLLHDKAEGEIHTALQPFGYFKPTITNLIIRTEQGFKLSYHVQPGTPVKLAEVDFQILGEGADDPLVEKVFPLAPGDVLDQTLYEQAKQVQLANMIERGYLDARYTQHQLEVDLQSYTASISLHLDSGMRLRFGEVRMNQDVMNPEFLARYLSFNKGDPFSQDALLALQGDLIDSEYFKQVEVVTRREEREGGQVPVDVNLKPNKRNRYRIGLGYSTDMGPRLTLDWKNRRRGRNGHRMRSELQISQPLSSLSSEYIIPLKRPTVDYVSFGASLEHFNSDTNQGNRALLSATHSVSLERGWRRSLGLEYSYEDFKVRDQEDRSRLLLPSVGWLRIKSDGKEFVQRGKRLGFRIEGVSESLFSSTSFIQLYASSKFIYGLGEGDWRVLTRLELGATWADDLKELPPSKRFFAGGDNTVRGFGYQDLGPRDEDDDVIGGRYLTVGSFALERHISGKWSGALFLDAGNAFDPDFDSETAYGVGFGVRWRSPVGPVRFDVANGSDGDERQWRLHIVVGPEL